MDEGQGSSCSGNGIYKKSRHGFVPGFKIAVSTMLES